MLQALNLGWPVKPSAIEKMSKQKLEIQNVPKAYPGTLH